MRRRSIDPSFRVGVGLWILIGFLTLWFQGAVGIIGSPDNTANLMFIAIPLSGFASAFSYRFRSQAMATISRWLAIATLAVVAVELILQTGREGPIWPKEVIGIGLVFAMGWWLAARCFAKSSNTDSELVAS